MLINKKVEVTNARLVLTNSLNSSVGDTSLQNLDKFYGFYLYFLLFYLNYLIGTKYKNI